MPLRFFGGVRSGEGTRAVFVGRRNDQRQLRDLEVIWSVLQDGDEDVLVAHVGGQMGVGADEGFVWNDEIAYLEEEVDGHRVAGQHGVVQSVQPAFVSPLHEVLLGDQAHDGVQLARVFSVLHTSDEPLHHRVHVRAHGYASWTGRGGSLSLFKPLSMDRPEEEG